MLAASLKRAVRLHATSPLIGSWTSTLARALSSAQPASRGDAVTFLSLNNLADNPGAVKTGRRIGRGIGSSKGKTSGRGHNGQNSRAGGGVRPTFEGGQTPLFKRLPKRGFTNNHAEPMVPINVGKLQDYIDMGRLPLPKEGDDPLTMVDLVNAGITKASTIKYGVKLLGDGADRLRSPIRIEISRASTSAIGAIEAAGGEITTVHYNRLALRALLLPHKFDILPKRAMPPPRLLTYYTSWENRGYLCPKVQLRKLNNNSSLDTPSDEAPATVSTTSNTEIDEKKN